MNLLVSLVAGLLFGIGLTLGGMTDPSRVLGFLDLAGHWDPTLAFVMGGALCVTLPAFQIGLRRMGHPVCAPKFSLPTKQDLDAPLLIGAALFGIGWGLSGLCPGPALARLATLGPDAIGFVIAMLIGMWLRNLTATK